MAKFITGWENHNFGLDIFELAKFQIEDRDKIYPILTISKTKDQTKYFVEKDCIPIFSSNDLYTAMEYANNLLKEEGFIELPKKLEILL
jgi:hypothetical protein